MLFYGIIYSIIRIELILTGSENTMDKAEFRRKRIINIVYYAIVLGLAYLFLKYCFSMFAPFLFAFFIAVIVQKPTNFITRKTKIKKGLTTTILVLLLYLIIAALISFIGVKCVDGIKSMIAFIQEKLSDIPTLIENVKTWSLNVIRFLPDGMEAKAAKSMVPFFDALKEKSATEIASFIMDKASIGEKFSLSSLSTPLSGIWSTAKQIPSVFVAVMIAIVSSCFMAVDYDRMVLFIKGQLSPENEEKLSATKRIVLTSLAKLIKSYALIICITGMEIFIGLNILSLIGIYKDGNILALSLIIAVLDILPVIGTGTFMVPWCIYSLITGKIGLGIGLFIVYAVIYVVRQIIEPKIVGGTVDLPPFVTLMGMYIGSQLFGFLGIFLLPILIIIIKLLNDEGVVHIWKKSDAFEGEVSSEPKIKIHKPSFFHRKKK